MSHPNMAEHKQLRLQNQYPQTKYFQNFNSHLRSLPRSALPSTSHGGKKRPLLLENPCHRVGGSFIYHARKRVYINQRRSRSRRHRGDRLNLERVLFRQTRFHIFRLLWFLLFRRHNVVKRKICQVTKDHTLSRRSPKRLTLMLIYLVRKLGKQKSAYRIPTIDPSYTPIATQSAALSLNNVPPWKRLSSMLHLGYNRYPFRISSRIAPRSSCIPPIVPRIRQAP